MKFDFSLLKYCFEVCLPLAAMSLVAAAAWYSAEGRALTGPVRFELINFISGNRTVSDIRNLVSDEYGHFNLAQARPASA